MFHPATILQLCSLCLLLVLPYLTALHTAELAEKKRTMAPTECVLDIARIASHLWPHRPRAWLSIDPPTGPRKKNCFSLFPSPCMSLNLYAMNTLINNLTIIDFSFGYYLAEFRVYATQVYGHLSDTSLTHEKQLAPLSLPLFVEIEWINNWLFLWLSGHQLMFGTGPQSFERILRVYEEVISIYQKPGIHWVQLFHFA